MNRALLTIEKDIINTLIIEFGLVNTSPIMCFSTSDDREPSHKKGIHFDTLESAITDDGTIYLLSGKFYDHDQLEIKDVSVQFDEAKNLSKNFFEKISLIPKEIKLSRCLF